MEDGAPWKFDWEIRDQSPGSSLCADSSGMWTDIEGVSTLASAER